MKYQRIALAVCLILAVLAAEWLWLRSEGRDTPAQSSALEPVQTSGLGGAFALTDHAGNPTSDRDFRGRIVLMSFGYTFCPDVCPTSLQRIAEAMDLLGPKAAEQVQPLFVTIDPERDSPEVLAAYVAAFHPRLIGLTGSPDELREVTANYRVYHAKVGSGSGEPEAGDYLIDHSAYIYLLGTDGRLLSYLRHDATAEAIAAVIAPLLGGPTQTANAP